MDELDQHVGELGWIAALRAIHIDRGETQCSGGFAIVRDLVSADR